MTRRRDAVDAVEAIRAFNADREPERLAMKLARLRRSPYGFFRGTCHLFHARLAEAKGLAKLPRVWCVGDAHLENFGSYRGDNRLVYFDLNDFDEAALGPVTLDPLRFLASVQVAAESLRASADEAAHLGRAFVDAYAAALAAGQMRWVERETAQGLVRDLLDGLRDRSRPEFLDRRTLRKRRRRVLRCDGTHALPATPEQHEHAAALVAQATADLPDPQAYTVLDVARRVAGTGSLGLERYVVLVQGKGSPDGNLLLDLKRAVPSSVSVATKVDWASEAERVVAIQRRMQAVPMALLHAVGKRKRSYVLRALQPSEDRVSLDASRDGIEPIAGVVREMGRLIAWAQLRSAGRQGSANADALIEVGRAVKDWRRGLLERAQAAAAANHADWLAFCAAYDRGAFAATSA